MRKPIISTRTTYRARPRQAANRPLSRICTAPRPQSRYLRVTIATVTSVLLLTAARADDTDTFYGLYAGYSNSSGFDNSGFGYAALFDNTTGNYNTAIGALSLLNNTTGNLNTAAGVFTLYLNTTGSYNSAVGYEALYGNTTGNFNTAIGYGALTSNNADANTATGYEALYHNTTGTNNTADGFEALWGATIANNNTAIGSFALYSTTTGSENTADGAYALQNNTTGTQNTATGVSALAANTTGNSNTADGWNALLSNTTGGHNLASGYLALSSNTTGSNNTVLGNNALLANTTGGSNIGIGDGAGSLLTTGSNNIEIGHAGNAAETNTIRIGKKGVQTKTIIAGIRDATVSGGIAVMIDANGRLGTNTSSARFKENIQPMDKTSDSIYSLHPVTFRYKRELDPAAIPQFGLVAEDVAKVNPDLVAYDDDRKPYSVRYDAVNAMLLNEFLKQQPKVKELEESNRTQLAIDQELETKIAQQNRQVDALINHARKLRHRLSVRN